MNDNKDMDTVSRSAGPDLNGMKGRQGDGGFAAIPTPASPTKKGAYPTKPDDKNIEDSINTNALEAAVSVVKADAVELQEKIFTNTIVPPILAFFKHYERGVRHGIAVDKKLSEQPGYEPR